MKKIYFQTTEAIKKTLTPWLLNHGYIISQEMDRHCLLIISVKTVKDLALIKEMHGFHDWICIIENGNLIFEILELQPLGLLREQHLMRDIEQLPKWLGQAPQLSAIMEFKSGDTWLRIPSEKIYYIESFLHYLTIHTESGDFKVRETMKEALLRLQPYGFSQIHKSFLINRHFLTAIHPQYCLINQDIRLPIGKKFKAALLSH